MAKARKPDGMIVDSQKPKKKIAVSFQSWTLLLLILVVIGYFISARTYASNYTHVIDVSNHYADESAPIPMTRITSARGELITFGIYLAEEDKTPWASPSGFQLVLNGLKKPLQLVKPSQPYWPASGTYYSVVHTHTDTPLRILWASIVLPESLAGPEERQLVGEIQGDYITPFSSAATLYHLPVQIHVVPRGMYLWTGGRILFYILTGISGLLYSILGLLHWRKSKQKIQGKGSLKRYLGNFFTILVAILIVYSLILFWGRISILDSKFPDVLYSMGFIMLIIVLLLILNWRSLSHLEMEKRSRHRIRTHS